MAGQVQVAARDFDGTRKSSSIAVGDATSDAARGTLVTELRKWILGSVAGSYNIKEVQADVGGTASSPAAQANQTLVLEMKDSVSGTVYKEKIPIVDMGKAVDGGSNEAYTATGQGQQSLTVMNSLHADYITLKAAIEAVWESPNGNSGTLERGYHEN